MKAARRSEAGMLPCEKIAGLQVGHARARGYHLWLGFRSCPEPHTLSGAAHNHTLLTFHPTAVEGGEEEGKGSQNETSFFQSGLG